MILLENSEIPSSEVVDYPVELDKCDAVDELEKLLLGTPEPDGVKLDHLFAAGVYIRQLTIPAGSVIVGHRHKQPCLNILIKGRVQINVDGEITEMVAPYTFVSGAGVRKAAIAVEETIWQNVHPMDLPLEEVPVTDFAKEMVIDRIEDDIIEKSPAWLNHNQQLEVMNELTTKEVAQ